MKTRITLWDRLLLVTRRALVTVPILLLITRPAVTQASVAGTFLLTISGIVYQEDRTTPDGGGVTVRLVTNGTDVGTTVTDPTSRYSFTVPVVAGDALLVYLDGSSKDAMSVTVAGAGDISDMDIFGRHLAVYNHNGGSTTNADIAAAKGGLTDIEIRYIVSGGNLQVTGQTKGLYVPAGHSFAPGGDTQSERVEIAGTLVGGTSTINAETLWDAASGTFVPGTSTVRLAGAFAGVLDPGGNPLHHVRIEKADASATVTLGAPLSIEGDLTIVTGNLDVSTFNYPVTLQGNLSNSGSFTARSGEVVLSGTGQALYGSTSFNKLTKVVSASDTLTFQSGSTQTVSDSVVLTGTAANLLNLRSDSPGARWGFALGAGATKVIDFVDVRDSDASPSALSQKPVDPTNSNDGGNNVDWYSTDLAVSQSVDIASPLEGDNVIFTIEIRNNGSSAASGTRVVDPLPAGLTYVSDVATRGAYDSGSGVWNVDTLSVGRVDSIRITASVNLGTGGSTISNTATVTADQTDVTPGDNSATTSITVRSGPSVVVAIPDTSVAMNSPPVASYRDLNNVFSDAEDGSALTFSIAYNSNPTLVGVAIDPDSVLGFNVSADQVGSATIVVSAMDSDLFTVNDTFVVDVINNAPIVLAAIPDTTVRENSPPVADYSDLTTVFTDAEDGNALTFSVASNSNPTLVSASIDADSTLDLSFGSNSAGAADIVVRATDLGGLFADDSLTVTVAGGVITLSSERLYGGPVRPGGTAQMMFKLVLANSAASPETLTTITFTNTSTGTGDTSQLDGDFSPMSLRAASGVGILAGGTPGDATASFDGGHLTFANLAAVIPGGGTLTLVVDGGASLSARDGDVLDLVVSDPTSVSFARWIATDAQWPIDPADTFPVDGMVAAQLTVHPIAATTFPTGSQRNLAMDITLPANGYEADRLSRIDIMNQGTATSGIDISVLEAWTDDGDGVFREAQDTKLGIFSFTGSRWELTGLGTDVPVGGLRVFVTADIAQTAIEGRTLQFALPTVPDVGVGMTSGNDGPIDGPAANPFAQSISSTESVVLSAAPLTPAVARPGDSDVTVLHLVASNNYAGPKRISRLTVNNATTPSGVASQADLDTELDGLILRLDGNDNGVLDDTATDPVIGTGVFFDGKVTFNGLTWDLPSGTSRHIFLTTDVSLSSARDGDVLGTFIAGAFDIDFADATAITANWPLDSQARVTVDGMLAAQLTNFDISAVTLAPGDGPILALDVLIPGNGYADDVLNGLEVINLGTAADGDIADMRVWRDGGDGQFSAGSGDDVEIGPLVWTGGSWKSPVLSESLPSSGTRVFVGLTVTSSPKDSASVRMSVPVGGITVASGNDGPIDTALASDQSLLLSTSPLLTSLEADPDVSTVGENIAVRMVVRNVGTENIDGITPSTLTAIGDAILNPVATVEPASFDLSPGATDTFTWTYSTVGPGIVHWVGTSQGVGQTSGLTRISLAASSNELRVFDRAGDLQLFPLESMPFLISRGQSDIVPLSLTFSASGSANASDASIVSLRLRIEDDQGVGIVPANLLSRIVVSEGNTTYLTKTSMETTGSEIDLTLATPALVSTIEQISLNLRLDISSTTVVPNFRLVIESGTSIVAEDAISRAPVDVSLASGAFPVATGVGRLVVAPTELDVHSTPAPAQRIGRDQTNVTVMTIELDNPGIDDLTTDIALGSVGLVITDTTGAPVPEPPFNRVRVTGAGGVFADRTLSADDNNGVLLTLSPHPTTAVGAPTVLTVSADVAGSAALGPVRFQLLDPTTLDARDSNTGAPVPVVYQDAPVAGGNLIVEAGAESLLVQGEATFPTTLKVGDTDVPAMTLTVEHPAPAGVGRIVIDELTIHFQDETRRALVPASCVSSIRIMKGDVEIANVTAIPTSGDRATVPVTGVVLEPSTMTTLEVFVDVATTAPASFLELLIDDNDIIARDRNTGADVTNIEPRPGATMPATSGLTQLLPPATKLVVGILDHMPAAVVAGASNVHAATVSASNTASAGSGDITLDHLVIRSSTVDFDPHSIGQSVRRVRVFVGGDLVGESDTLGVDSTTAVVLFAPPLSLEPQLPLEMELRLDLQNGEGAGSFRVGLARDDVGVRQPESALLRIDIDPSPGQMFPLWTEAGSFSMPSLRGSFSNYPNPFAAGTEPTRFVYYLSGDARVSLRIWSARGDDVITLRDGEPRPAGLYQDDVWSGLNGRGRRVTNGVYIAELVVDYETGGRERLLRKVAVIR